MLTLLGTRPKQYSSILTLLSINCGIFWSYEFGQGTQVEEAAPEKEAETTEPKPEQKPKLPLTWDNVQEAHIAGSLFGNP